MPVDMVGFPCNMLRLKNMSEQYGFKIIEDSCQADGGGFGGKRLGVWGDAGCLSFNDYKIMSAGEGGAVLTNDRQIYERAMIYHDGGATFRPYSGDIQEPFFMGTQYRVSEITGAVLRVQLQRLDGILSDLRRTKRAIMSGLADSPGVRFAPSHDAAGDCGTTLAFTFENEARARRFGELAQVSVWLPIDSGKHVYTNWDPLLSGRGAHHPALNPFNLPQNKGLRINYSKDMCLKTLDILARTAYISLRADWTDEKIDSIINACRQAFKQLAAE
jgi:dTDP-4-amino-4,6-dideoxygalactose transaminase